MLYIGLTGGIGSGKSTAATRFSMLGIPVIDTDVIAREVTKPGEPGYKKIIDELGNSILSDDATLNRAHLRDLAFSNPKIKKTLESILHPLIREKMWAQAANAKAPYCVFVVPLLIETEQYKEMDRVLVIDTSEELQITRAKMRDETTSGKIEAIIKGQVDRKTRLSFADDVIHNIGDLDALYSAIDRLDRKYRQLAILKGEPKQEKNPEAAPQVCNEADQTASSENKPPYWLTNYLMTQSSHHDEQVSIEFPLQERARTFLRLESLFKELRYYLDAEDQLWNTRNVVKTLLAIQQVFQMRPDTKAEMIKEADRFHTLFSRYVDYRNVDTEKLQKICSQLKDVAGKLRAMTGKPGEQIRKNDLIAALKQKENIPGGPLDFDLPSFGYWLNEPKEIRCRDILDWFSEFEPIEACNTLLLNIIRESCESRECSAKSGFYQANLELGNTYHMVRLKLPQDKPYLVELSGGQHRFTLHFFHATGTSRPKPISENITFELSCCAL